MKKPTQEEIKKRCRHPRKDVIPAGIYRLKKREKWGMWYCWKCKEYFNSKTRYKQWEGNYEKANTGRRDPASF